MNLHDDFLLEHVSPKRAARQLAMYAVYLATGNTLFHKTVKSSTVATYLRNVARLIKSVSGLDPRYDCPTDLKMSPGILKVLNQMKTWEQLPKRREPFTLDMLLDLIGLSRSCDSRSLLPALRNHFTCGLYAGNRTGEWAQTNKSSTKLGSHLKNKRGNTEAFTLKDVSFRTDRGAPYPLRKIVEDPDTIPRFGFNRYDMQKNGDHGEEKKFERNDHSPDLCYVRNQMAIVQRFVALVGWDYDLPLSIYLPDGSTTPRNITSTEIEYGMNLVAKRVFNLNPKKPGDAQILEKWGGHSLRVGACVYLYTSGFSEMELKFLLRWKSDSYRCYLRNLAFVCRKQNKALNDAFKLTGTMPNFL